MSVAAAAAEMPAGAAQREEALPEALLAILGYLVDDPKSLARAGAVGRAWREAAAANGESLWEQASTSIPLLDIMMAWIGFADEAKARPPCRRARHPIPRLNIGERRGVLRWARRRPLRRPRSTIAPSRTAPTSSALSLASPLPSPPPPPYPPSLFLSSTSPASHPSLRCPLVPSLLSPCRRRRICPPANDWEYGPTLPDGLLQPPRAYPLPPSPPICRWTGRRRRTSRRTAPRATPSTTSAPTPGPPRPAPSTAPRLHAPHRIEAHRR
jgi:hypothetical protein